MNRRPRSSLLHPAATPLGSLTLAEAPLIDAENLFRQPGPPLSYGNDQNDNFRRAAIYADRILKGDKPSELPVQAPVNFELVINLKTAKALGLDVPLFLQ